MPGPKLASLAWRNLWRNRRRTLITLVSIAFGTFLAVIFTGIGDATYATMIDHTARLGGGHVVIQHREYADLPSAKKSVALTDALQARATSDPDVVIAVPRVAAAAMLATSADSTGMMIVGIDPRVETDKTLGLLDAIAEGEMFKSPDDPGIILGATLAEQLGVKLGRKVVYTLTNKHGDIASGLARVSGIVKTGSPSIDGGVCFLPIDRLREALSYEPGEITQLAVFVDGHRKAPALAARLAEALPADAVALTWDQASPELAGFIAMKTGSALIMEVIITVLISAGIFNTLFVSVMERLREFGVMIAIGFSSRQIFALIMWESLWVSLTGLVAAALMTAGPYYYLATAGIDYSAMVPPGSEIAGVALEPILRVAIYPPHLLGIAAAVVLATLASGLYPAWKAGSIEPVETIRLV
ncbi:MAG: FtsX-like permease family protein [Nannocystaceae bacterium]|nr:ABC transporter permease [Myxococcales bacterium]